MTAGEALVLTLIEAGARHGFGVPGESYLALLEAMRRHRERFRFIAMRHEGGAAFAAEAYGKASGMPGLAFVTRGPGATNAAIGVHTAAQDSTPLILFVGQVASRRLGHESFQEIDYARMYGAIAKAVIAPQTPAALAAAAAQAWCVAQEDRPGPVVVVLPEDLSQGEARGTAAVAPARARAPAAALVSEAAALLVSARRPVIVAGGLVNHERARDELAALADLSGAVVAAAWRRQDAFANDHPAYGGHLGIGRAPFQRAFWAECDVVLAAGARLDDITTEDGTLLRPDQTLIHMYPDRVVLARSGAKLAIDAALKPTLEALARALAATPPPPERLAWRDAVHRSQSEFATPGRDPAVAPAGALDMARVVDCVGARLRPDDIVTNDAGNFAGWLHRYFPYRAPGSQLAATSGAMGYAVPAALAAALVRPDRRAVAFAGDGGFLMTGQELSIAAHHGLPLIVVVCDNGQFGTIAFHQSKRYGPSQTHGVVMPRVDLAILARAYGAHGQRIERTAAFEPAFAAALERPGPTLLHLIQDPRDISAFGRLDLQGP